MLHISEQPHGFLLHGTLLGFEIEKSEYNGKTYERFKIGFQIGTYEKGYGIHEPVLVSAECYKEDQERLQKLIPSLVGKNVIVPVIVQAKGGVSEKTKKAYAFTTYLIQKGSAINLSQSFASSSPLRERVA